MHAFIQLTQHNKLSTIIYIYTKYRGCKYEYNKNTICPKIKITESKPIDCEIILTHPQFDPNNHPFHQIINNREGPKRSGIYNVCFVLSCSTLQEMPLLSMGAVKMKVQPKLKLKTDQGKLRSRKKNYSQKYCMYEKNKRKLLHT